MWEVKETQQHTHREMWVNNSRRNYQYQHGLWRKALLGAEDGWPAGVWRPLQSPGREPSAG